MTAPATAMPPAVLTPAQEATLLAVASEVAGSFGLTREDRGDAEGVVFEGVCGAARLWRGGLWEQFCRVTGRRAVIDWLRRERFWRCDSLPQEFEGRSGESVEERVFARMELARVRQAQGRLQREDQQALGLLEVAASADEVARALGIRAGSLRLRVHRARGRLRAAMAEGAQG